MEIKEMKTYLIKLENNNSGRIITELIHEENAFMAIDEAKKKNKGDSLWLLVDVKVVE